MKGYAGHLLRVNLTDGSIRVEALDPHLAKDYLGGRGFGAYILYTEVPHGTDPLGPDNRLILSSGSLSGLLVPGAGKMDITAKSPATGGYASASVGGLLNAELRYAGYDALVLEGISERPVYLVVDDEQAELRDAAPYWGRGAIIAERALKQALGEDFQMAVIGPAGENLVRFACINHDFGRQAGRGGVGAVMGAKRLKAIAVRGSHSIPLADADGFHRLAREMYQACMAREGLAAWQHYGTSMTTEWANQVGAFPTRNFQAGALDDYMDLEAESMRRRLVVADKACFACPSPCGKYSYSRKRGFYVEGPEYETTALLGGNCALKYIEDVAYANYLCDEYGLDTISAGNVIGFAIECFERGIIGLADTEGLELRFGEPACVFELICKIALREGIGDVLAQGVKAAAEAFGQGSADFAMQVKGLEMSGYESRNAPAMLLSYMTCDVGAHHNRSWAITYDIQVGRDRVTPDKVARVIELQHIRPLFDCLGACRLQWVELGLDLDFYPRVLRAVTGLDRTWSDLLAISERVWNLTRMFWVREVEGFGRSWDYPPPRTWKDPVAAGPTQGKRIAQKDIDRLLNMYYEQRGWTPDGIPTPAKLQELGLAFLVQQ
jgi:aldehyde:ferredoxin oxidoreductase